MCYPSFAAVLMILSAGVGTGRTSKSLTRNFDGAEKLVETAAKAIADRGPVAFADIAFCGGATSFKKEDRPTAEAALELLAIKMEARFGKRVGDLERVGTDKLGRSLVRYTYMEKHERAPILWQFTFYRPEGGGWQWHGFDLNDAWVRGFHPAGGAVPCAEAETLSESGIDALKAGGVPKLIEAIFASGKSLLPAGDRNGAVELFVKLRDTASAPLGKASGAFELIRTETCGKSLIRYAYLEKCERGGILWEFTLYRAQKEWQWLNLSLINNLTNSFTVGK